MISVGIVDDHIMVTQGIASMLEGVSEIELNGIYHSGEAAWNDLEKIEFDVILLDINLPGINGIELCTKIQHSFPTISIIGLSNYDDSAFIKNMIRSGALGYLLKNTKKEELITAIKTVFKGEKYIPTHIQTTLLNESLGIGEQNHFIPKLSRREKEILELIADEMTSNEIAEKLFISLKTVETHRKNLHQKLNVRNTAGLIKIAIQKGLISV